MYKCNDCNSLFKHRQSYIRHLSFYTEPHCFLCEKCGKVFRRIEFLNKHYCDCKRNTSDGYHPSEIKSKHYSLNIEEKSSSVGRFNREAPVENDRRIYVANIQNTKNISYKCEGCKWIFLSESTLIRHLNIYKENHFVYPCCGQFLKGNKSITNHLCASKIHKNYKSKIDIKKQSQMFSSGPMVNKPYKCLGCPASFFQLHSLKQHMKKYPEKHDFSCTKCDKDFPKKSLLLSHLCMFEESKSFSCSCSRYFSTLREFREHIGFQRPYYCCTCKKKSITFSNLIKHIRMHTKEKPYICHYCKKSFSVKERLKIHLRSHSGINPFKCSICIYSSSTKWNVKLHEKKHHLKQKKMIS